MVCADCSQKESEPETNLLTPRNFAGFWRRFVAFCIIDCILIIGTLVSGAGAISGLIFGTNEGPLDSLGLLLMLIVYFVFPWLYLTCMEASSRQATLGKLALGIKVTDIKGAPISFLRASARYFGKFSLFIILVIGTSPRHINFQAFGRHTDIICALIFFVGFSMAVLTPKKQTIYDIIARTLVVKKEAPLKKTSVASPDSEASQSNNAKTKGGSISACIDKKLKTSAYRGRTSPSSWRPV
jgi:uncharacterized RDD family membrane protein YckC